MTVDISKTRNNADEYIGTGKGKYICLYVDGQCPLNINHRMPFINKLYIVFPHAHIWGSGVQTGFHFHVLFFITCL